MSSPGSPRMANLTRERELGRWIGTVTLRVRYAETDRMGIAYNAHYLTWFEIGRTEFMRSAGFPYRQVEERGIRLPLVEASFRLRHTLAYDDVIVTRTWIDGLRSRTVAFAYEILHDGRTAATGRTLHACVDAASGRGVSFPAWLKSKIAPLSD